MCIVVASMLDFTSEERERRNCVLLWLSHICKHSARMTLVNHSDACGSEVRPLLEPTCIIAGNDKREQRQRTNAGNEGRELRLRQKKKNQD